MASGDKLLFTIGALAGHSASRSRPRDQQPFRRERQQQQQLAPRPVSPPQSPLFEPLSQSPPRDAPSSDSEQMGEEVPTMSRCARASTLDRHIDMTQSQRMSIDAERTIAEDETYHQRDGVSATSGNIRTGESISSTQDTSMAMDLDSNDMSAPVLGARYTYRDNNGILRQVWQPGDGDGQRDGEFPDVHECKQRFRFFQHDIGPIVRGCNEPPKWVFLDDKAAYDISKSGAYTYKELVTYWFHDFTKAGTVRASRPNRGRAAVVSEGEGDWRETGHGKELFGWAWSGVKKNSSKYYFTGERGGYAAIQFPITNVDEAQDPAVAERVAKNARKVKRAIAREENVEGPAREPRHKKARVSVYLRGSPSPPWPSRDRRARLNGGSMTDFVPRGDVTRFMLGSGASRTHCGGFVEDEVEGDGGVDNPAPNSEPVPCDPNAKTMYAGMTYHNVIPVPSTLANRDAEDQLGATEDAALWDRVAALEAKVEGLHEALMVKVKRLRMLEEAFERCQMTSNGRDNGGRDNGFASDACVETTEHQ